MSRGNNSGDRGLFINMSDLSSQGSTFKKTVLDELKETVNNMKSLKDACDWEGIGSNAFFKVFDEEIEKMQKMCDTLVKLGNFMENVSNEFSTTSNSVSKDFQSNPPISLKHSMYGNNNIKYVYGDDKRRWR